MGCLSWYDEATGTEVPFYSVLRVHQLLDRLRERTAAKLLHLPPPLTSSGEPGPPSASLSNTIPAAEFLSPSLDEILLSAFNERRGAEVSTFKGLGTPDNDSQGKSICSSGLLSADNITTEIGDVSALQRPDCVEESTLFLRAWSEKHSHKEKACKSVSLALLQHDTSDPCCCWTASTKDRGLRHQGRGISACAFDQYYPLGNEFIRKAIKAFGGCPLCCSGSCGGTARFTEGKQALANSDVGEENDCLKRETFWGSPAPVVLQSGRGTVDAVSSETSAAHKISSSSGGPASGEASGDTGNPTHTCRTRRQPTPSTDKSKERNKRPCDDFAALQSSPQENCRRQQSRRCSRLQNHTTYDRSSSSSGQPLLKGIRARKSSSAAGPQALARLVQPLSLHDNRGFRRSAWDALEASLCELLAEAEAEEGSPSYVSGKESSSNCRASRPRRLSLLSPAEARMLLVVLQSRLGYVCDLRELPVSAVKNYPYEIAGVGAALRRLLLKPKTGPPPVPLSVPLPPSVQRLRMQQAALEMALQQEQRVNVYPFSASAASAADKLVVDGWGWLPFFLSVQVSPFVITEATVKAIHIRQACQSTLPSFPCSLDRELEDKAFKIAGTVSSGGDLEDGGEVHHSSDIEDDGDWGSFANSHPVRLRVEVNPRLHYSASHGLPQASGEQNPPTHVW